MSHMHGWADIGAPRLHWVDYDLTANTMTVLCGHVNKGRVIEGKGRVPDLWRYVDETDGRARCAECGRLVSEREAGEDE